MTLTDTTSVVIASSAAPVRASLKDWCDKHGIAVNTQGTIWLVDGAHPSAEHPPKEATIIVLGPIPHDITPTHTLPAPISLTTLRETLLPLLGTPAPTQLRAGWNFDPQHRTIRHEDGTHVSLTEKEAALLQQLLQTAPAETSRETLLAGVWAYEKDVDTHTLETHIYRLRQKLGDGPFDLVTTEQGYKVVL